MSRDYFHEELGKAKTLVLKMGDLVYELLSSSIEALTKQNETKASEIAKKEDQLDEMELQVENLCMKLLALQQPIAIDLRNIAATLKISADLERIGDHIHKIALKTIDMAGEPYKIPLDHITQMSNILLEMTKEVLNAFVNINSEKAKQIIIKDQSVDQQEHKISQAMLKLMTQKTDETTINQAVQFLFISRYLERIGDHLSNVAERIMYIETGEIVTHFLE